MLGRLVQTAIAACAVMLCHAPAIAQPLRAMQFERGPLVSPASAISFYGSSTTRSSSFAGAAGFESRAPELVEQARALNNNPDQIFEYVRNHIETEFAYGLRKGALGAYIDRSGTPFDQNVLFVELVRQAGYTARYRLGTITLTQAQFTEWTGVSHLAAACRMLAFGGMPAAFNGQASSAADCTLSGSLNSVTLRHIWSEVNIGGTWYAFDPSYKVQAVAPRRDLESASGLTPGGVAAQAAVSLETGTASGAAYIRSVNDTAVDAYLTARSTALLSDLAANAPAADMREVVGGGEIEAAYAPANGFRSAAPPYPAASVTTITGDIPNQYRTGFHVTATTGFGTVARQMWVDEIYGRRLELDSNFYADRITTPGDYFDVELRLELDDVTLNIVSNPCASEIYQPSCTLPGYTFDGDITVNHPYAADGGAYADRVYPISGAGAISTAILHGWGQVSPALGTKWGLERDEDRSLPNRVAGAYQCDPEWLCQPAYETPSGDMNRHRMGAAWLAQMTRMLELQGEVGRSEIQHHHSVGTVTWGHALTTFDPMPGLPGPVDFGVTDQQLVVDAGTALSVSSRIDDAVRTRAVSRAVALAAATLEGSVVEQMQDLPDGASTASRLAWGNRPDDEDPCGGTRRRFYDFSGTSTTTRNGLIVFEGLANGCDAFPPTAPGDRSSFRSGYNVLVGNLIAAGYTVFGASEAYLGPGARVGVVRVPTTCGELGCVGPDYAPSTQRGAAVIANRFDSNGDVLAVSHLVTGYYGPAKGGGGTPPERNATTYDPRRAADVLRDRFSDRSSVLGVNLQTGSVSYATPTLLSVGSGEGAPYRLDYRLAYQNAPDGCSPQFGPCVGPVQGGWTDNWDIRFSLSGSGLEAMGETSPLAATDTVVAFMAMQDVFGQGGLADLRKDIYGAIIADWWRRRMVGNVATVNRGFQASQYIRQANGSWMAPIGSPGVLTQTGARTKVRDICGQPATGGSLIVSTARRWDASSVGFNLRSADGQVMTFDPWEWTYSTDQCGKVYGFELATWSWPQGPSLDITTSTTGRVTAITSSLGRTLTVGTSATSGGRTAGFSVGGIRDSAGAAWTYRYAPAVSRSATQRPRPFEMLHQVYEPVAPALPALQFDYDAIGRVREAHDATALQWGLRGPHQFLIADGARGERIDPQGGRYVVHYDTDRDPVRHIDEIGRETISAFDGRHRVVSRTYPEGDRDLFAYDARDNITMLTRQPKQGSPLADLMIEASWNPTWNRPDWIDDPLNRRTDFSYYASGAGAGLLSEARQPAVDGVRPTWLFQYNADGLLTRETDPTGRANTHVYDAAGNRTATTIGVSAVGGPALNLTTIFTPDSWGDTLTALDPRGNATTYQYDAMRRVTGTQRRNGGASATPLIRSERLYDALGRVARERTASALNTAGNATAWAEILTAYTPTGQIWRVTDPDGRVTTRTYDSMDRLASVLGAEGDVTAFGYDLAGQQLTETRSVASPVEIVYATHAYTLNGQRAWVEDANANRTAYAYDGFDRLVETRFPNPATGGPNPADYESQTYDLAGNVLTRRTRRGVTISSVYDPLNRVSSTVVPAHGSVAERTTTFGYDLAGRQTTLGDTQAHALAHAYDAAGRLTSTTTSGPQWSGGRTVAWQYDGANNRVRVTWPDAWYVQYGFDAANRMTSASQGGSFTLASFAWDPLSRRSTITYPGGASMTAIHTPGGDQTSRSWAWSAGGSATWTQTYDFVHRLTTAGLSNAAFRWSPPGGSTSYEADRLNRYASVGGTALAYDLNGNLTGDGTQTYEYDAWNRMLAAAGPGMAAAYQYDPLGRRTLKTVNGTTTAFLSDGADEIAEYNGSGALIRRYVQGPMVDQPIAQVEANGTRRYLLQDRLGSIVGATNDAGALTDGPYAYDPYGLPDTTAGLPYRYTGRRYDPETGLYYYRARYYSPTLGRFLQTDPIGYADDLNLYGYVANDPVNLTDPTGRESFIVGRRIFTDEQAANAGRAAYAAAGGGHRGRMASAAASAAVRNTKHAFLVITAEGTNIEQGQIEGIYSYGPSNDGTGLNGMGNTSFRSNTGDGTDLDDIATIASIISGSPDSGVSVSQIGGVTNEQAAQIFGAKSENRLYSPVPGAVPGSTNSNSEAFARGHAAATAGGTTLVPPAGIFPGAGQTERVICPSGGKDIC